MTSYPPKHFKTRTRPDFSFQPQFLFISTGLRSKYSDADQKIKVKSKNAMYPNLHDKVSRLLEGNDLYLDFHEDDDARTCTKTYDTIIMGRFICRNPACISHGWSSKQVAITIRMYYGAQYNARVYNQRCQRCNRLGEPRPNDSYEERVAYRLKKWCGIEMDQPAYSGKSKDPPQSDLCEGCKDGHRKQLSLAQFY